MKFLVLAVLQLVVTTTATNSTATVDKSAECIEAVNAVANEDDELAKLPLKLACAAACAGVDCAGCGTDEEEGCRDEEEDEAPDCAGTKEYIDRAIKGLEDEDFKKLDKHVGMDRVHVRVHVWTFIEDHCNEVCAAEGKENCASFSSAIACEKAKEMNETCGFLVNGLSFVLFAILAIFKY